MQVLLAEFMQNRNSYTHAMAELGACEYISFDHIFKSCIKHWLFKVRWQMGDTVHLGQVTAWQFTKSTSSDEVENLLNGVKAIHSSATPLLLLVDNCCSLANKLQQTFGQDVIVKFDIWHAIQRVLKKVSKRHPLYSLFTSDFKLVFRDSTDLSKDRNLTTPDAAQILKNIKKFMAKWSDCRQGVKYSVSHHPWD